MTFSMLLQLAGAALLPVVFSVVFYVLNKRTSFGKLPHALKQVIFGVVFGGLAVIGTEFGINTGTATVNARDAAPLCAGLLFGAPAGLIAGFIGGIERWFACYWGAAQFSRIACSISTCLAGIYAAVLRKFMFDNRRPSSFLAMAIALVMEVIHLNMLFLTNLQDAATSFTVVRDCTIPMLLMNAMGVFLATLLVRIIAGDFQRIKLKRSFHLTERIQRSLLVCVTIAFLVTNVFVFILQNGISKNQTQNIFHTTLQDIDAEIQESSDSTLLGRADQVAKALDREKAVLDNALLDKIRSDHNLSEINLIDRNGIIFMSTRADYIGFDMMESGQSREFMDQLIAYGEAVLPYQPISYDASVSFKYAGVMLKSGDYLQVGYDFSRFSRELQSSIRDVVTHRHIGESGYLIVVDPNDMVVCAPKGMILGAPLPNDLLQYMEKNPEDRIAQIKYKHSDYYMMYVRTEGYTTITLQPLKEASFSRDIAIYVNAFMEIIVFAFLYFLIYILIKKLVVRNIEKINNTLGEITSGNLEAKVDVTSTREFASLSDDINSTVDRLKEFIAEAAARIDAELEFARQVQASSLPSIFPAFPEYKEFDLYASMDPAKEVGGDFYDFYFITPDKLVVMISDVSGKGIPAAMFMMTAKGIIKSLAERNIDLAEVYTMANEKLCEGNDAGLFITSWIAIIDLSTGHVEYVNAGHNPPLLKQANGQYEYLAGKPGFVLAGMDGYRYKKYEMDIEPGAELFLYTDGVTEATDLNNQLYGEQRLKDMINSLSAEIGCKELCEDIRGNVDKFVDGADQFDDITMLSFKFFKRRKSE